MERGKMSRYQDIYAEYMAKYGLERGIRGSEARHIGQHEYYRDCMVKKKGLEEDIGNLSTEKEQLGAETRSLEKRKKELERGNSWMEKTITETKAVNERMTRQNSELEKRNRELERSNSSLIATNTSLADEKKALEAGRKEITDEIAVIESAKSRLIAERSAYVEATETARKEKETALREADYWGWGILSFVWLCALAGIILCFCNLKEHSNLETICYIAMGCSIFVGFKPLCQHVPPVFIYWLIGEGVSYITGAVFYSFPQLPYMHSVFHLFVLGGTICHMMALWYIL